MKLILSSRKINSEVSRGSEASKNCSESTSLIDTAADDRNRSPRQCDGIARVKLKSLPECGAVGIGMALSTVRMPDVLLRAESRETNRTAKVQGRVSVVAIERDVHGVRIGRILVDQHQRPLT